MDIRNISIALSGFDCQTLSKQQELLNDRLYDLLRCGHSQACGGWPEYQNRASLTEAILTALQHLECELHFLEMAAIDATGRVENENSTT